MHVLYGKHEISSKLGVSANHFIPQNIYKVSQANTQVGQFQRDIYIDDSTKEKKQEGSVRRCVSILSSGKTTDSSN